MKHWTDKYLTKHGWFHWMAWDETQAGLLGHFWFKWTARRALKKYAKSIDY